MAESGPAGGEGIYVMNADGTNVQPILLVGTNGLPFVHTPALSPDARTVVISGEHDLFVVDLDGTNLRQLTATPLEDAAGDWSPDGQWIAFEGDTGGGCIYRIHPDGTNVERLTIGCSQGIAIHYSPDGRYLAWAGGPHGPDDIHVIDAGGGNDRQLTSGREITEFSWGP